MTNSFNKMAGKNSAERNGTPGRPRSTTKLRPMKVPPPNQQQQYINSIATPPRSKSISIPNNNNNNEAHVIMKQRLTLTPSPTVVSTPPSSSVSTSVFSKSFGSSPSSRTSPGLMAGHFAGGKWTEPPSPASLPKPPQHWTQLIFNNNCSKYANNGGSGGMGKPQQTDIASQLKVLLNVQA